MRWQRSPLGVVYLAEPDGSEHYRACAGVPYVVEPEPVSPTRPAMLAAEPVLIPEPVSAEPEPDPIAALGDELDEAERMHDAYARDARDARKVAEWPDLRRAILAYGGIGPSPDWPRDWYPGDLYRANGKAPDLVAAEAVPYAPWGDTGDDSAMLDYLHRSWSEWQRAQVARRPRARKVEPVAVSTALAEPVTTPRALLVDVARLVADVAALVAEPGGMDAGTLAAIARSASELAQLVART